MAVEYGNGTNGEGGGCCIGPFESISKLPSASRLIDVDTTFLPNGSTATVGTVKDVFYLDTAPSAAVVAATDGITIVAPILNPAHRWIRRELLALDWGLQATWFVDAALGNDENVGSAAGAAALNTLEELERRLRNQTLLQTTDVTCTGDFTGHALRIRGVTVAGGTNMLRVHGAVTSSAPSTFTGVTAENVAANQALEVADAARVANWSADFGKRVRITQAGARLGCEFWIAKDTAVLPAAPQARVSPSAKLDLTVIPQAQNPTLVTPIVGDSYVLDTLTTKADFLELEVYRSSAAGLANFRACSVDSIDFADPNSESTFSGNQAGGFNLVGCRFANTRFSADSQGLVEYAMCEFYAVADRFYGMQHSIAACLMRSTSATVASAQNVGGGVVILQSTLCQNVRWTCVDDGFRIFANLGVFDCAGGSAAVQADNQRSIVSSGGTLYGAGNSGIAAKVNSAAVLTYQNKPTITGSVPGVNDADVGGLAFAWAAIPQINPANNAAIVLNA